MLQHPRRLNARFKEKYIHVMIQNDLRKISCDMLMLENLNAWRCKVGMNCNATVTRKKKCI